MMMRWVENNKLIISWQIYDTNSRWHPKLSKLDSDQNII